MKLWKRIPRLLLFLVLFALIAGLGIAAIEGGGSRRVYSALEKAFYLSSDDAVWIQPGLHVQIVNVQIPSDLRPLVTFRLSDDSGQGLDKDGKLTPGTINPGIILASIPKGQTQYVSYTTRTVTSPITKVTAIQAGTDSGGTYTVRGDGTYDYKFKTVLPSNYDVSVTHTLGIYASRDLSAFGLSRYVDDQLYSFVPNGTQVTTIRQVAVKESCNLCHDPISAHGSTGRQGVDICILCHTPQTTDPDTGNTVDMKVMVHKIHMGSSLPSVAAGKPYQIIGNAQVVQDYSTVVFPQDIRNCTTCHNAPANSGVAQPAQMNAWNLNPTRATCGSCHDDINWTTGANHAGGYPQTSDKDCGKCHWPQGDTEYDATIINAHIPPYKSTQLRYPKIQITKIANTAAGQKPAVTFKLTDKTGAAINPATMAGSTGALRLTLAGPTSDYRYYVSESADKATANSDGTYTYTFTATVPTTATGSYAIEAEGYLNATLNPGPGNKPLAQRDAFDNVVVPFAVTGTTATARRTAVDQAKCLNCHDKLQLHGGNRNQVAACVVCHNPATTDSGSRPASANPAQGIDMQVLIHRIHTGENLNTDFTIYGHGNSVNNFNDIRFPGDTSDCLQCHVANAYTLPLPKGVTATTDPRGYWDPMLSAAAACLGCHDSVDAAAHALINTSSALGESCPVCHKESADFAVSKVHAH